VSFSGSVVSVIGLKLSRNIWIAIAVWVLLLGVLIVALPRLGLSSTVVGGALGAYCGAALAVGFTLRERAAVKARQRSGSDSGPDSVRRRYGRQ
jgi:drug/metabolite transporter (DMT)-like permease